MLYRIVFCASSLMGILAWFLIFVVFPPRQNSSVLDLSNPSYNTEIFELMPWEDHPKLPLVHAPSPISQALYADIVSRSECIVFEENEQGRLWSRDIVARLDTLTIKDVMKNLKSMVIVYLKMKIEKNRHAIVGGSEGGDLARYTQIAICDELALSNGIWSFSKNLEERAKKHETPLKEEQTLLKTLYGACRMTNIGAHRGKGPYTRSAFLPTAEELSCIVSGLRIDQVKDVLCTYRLRK